jgi:alkanesulfonate monooxygenase SsuD/methylene tetrahydromethanopterin reductase-like flavin-dependent oxidoreductase (luciferase family)
VVPAKELATLEQLCGGRVILGVGVGWLKEGYEALGVPWDGRGRRGEESIAAIRALWSDDRVSYHGETVSCYLRPQPSRGTIPIHVGGHSPTAARREAV